MKHILSLLLAVVLTVSCAVPAQAASTDYTGDVLLAVNTDRSTTSKNTGTFAGKSMEESSPEALALNGGQTGIFDQYVDPITGETITLLEHGLQNPQPMEAPAGVRPMQDQTVQTADYATGSTFALTDYGYQLNTMVCLYVGTYCTVWGATSDPSAIRLDSARARDIGQAFDQYFVRMTDAFGDYWCDVDDDEKIALMCYDIDHEYAAGQDVGAYTAGYFWGSDMIDERGFIGDQYYGPGAHINGIDCVHIDTYPGMGGLDDLMGDVSRCYGTLFHELQHLINFSWDIKGDLEAMETYLDEAFAMAATHVILGPEAASGRVSRFNSDAYTPGTSLTCWSGLLDNYSNSYLFGQYIRTQYGLKTGTDGVGVFKAVFNNRNRSNDDDTLQVVADLLDTTPEQLLQDFWKAVYLKQKTGPYGFAGEEWSYGINTKVAPTISSVSGSNGSINAGGAKFFSMGTDRKCTVTKSTRLVFHGLNNADADQGPPPKAIAAGAEIRNGYLYFYVTASKDVIMYFTCRSYDTPVTKPDEMLEEVSIGAGDSYGIYYSYTPGQPLWFYFYLEDTIGQTSPIQCIYWDGQPSTPGDTEAPTAVQSYVLREDDSVVFTVSPSEDCTIYYACYIGPVSSQIPLTRTKSLKAYGKYGWAYQYTPDQPLYFYFELEDAAGNRSPRQLILWEDNQRPTHTLTIDHPEEGCDLTVTRGGEKIYSGGQIAEGDVLTVTAELWNDSWELQGIYVDGQPLEGSTFTVTGDHTVSVRVSRKPVVSANAGQGSVTISYEGTDCRRIAVGFYNASGRLMIVAMLEADDSGTIVLPQIRGAAEVRAMLLGDDFIPLCLAAVLGL